MNLDRITELTNQIFNWKNRLKTLKDRLKNLEKEISKVDSMQERLDFVREAAIRRTAGLSALGLRDDFLEEIVQPFRNLPDCGGVSSDVKKEMSGMEDEILETNKLISWADQEKQRLELEDVV